MNELKKKLQQKRRSGKGFTLMEMLIVVAIIAILVAIAIPTFNSSLEKTRQAADQANARSLKSVCVTEYMMNNTTGTYGLDAASGTAIKLKDDGTLENSSDKPYEPQSKKYESELGSGKKYITCTISVSTVSGHEGEMIVEMNPSDILG